MNTNYHFDSMDSLRQALSDPTIDRDELRARLAAMGRTIIRRDTQPEVNALLAAGWALVLPEGVVDPEPFQWQWRRPGKRGGRLFRSTSQAYNALVRDREEARTR